MATISSLNVEIGASIGGFEKGVKAVEGGLHHLGAEAARTGAAFGGSVASGMDAAAAAASKAGRAIEGSAGSFANAARDYQAIGRSIQSVGESLTKYVTLPITLLAGASIKAYGDLQALEKGFNAVYKGAAPAADEMAKLREVAKLPGLGLKEAIQGSISLQAVGFSAEQSRKTLSAFGNSLATVGKGKADLDGVTLALTQIASKGKISAEEINQIAERVPQIRKVMQNVFGTADTEQLQKMGISAEEFIFKVTEELAKLPPVTGGINNAFENMADAGFIALSKIGESINNTFNVEGIFNRIGEALTAAAEAFSTLNPATQTAIFVFAGLAAAAGPLLLAIGGIVSALPILAAGFAVLTGPVGIAVAGIAAAAALLVMNWDSVVSYFQNSGLAATFSSLGASVGSALSGIVDVVTQFAGILKPLWDGIITVFSTNFTESIQFTATALGAAFEVMGKLLKLFGGTWEDSWTNFKNVIVSVWNGIVGVITSATSAIVKVGGGLASAFGMDGVAARFNEGAASINSLGESLKTAYYGAEQLARSPLAQKESVFGRGIQEAFGGIPDSMMAATTSITAVETKLNDFVRTPHEKKVKVTVDKVDKVEGLSSRIAEEIQKIKPTAFNNAPSLPELLGLEQNRFDLPIGLTLPPDVAAQFAALQAQVAAGMEPVTGIIVEMTGFMQQALTSAFVGVGELIGGLLSGNISGAGAFFTGILGVVLDFVGQFGKLLVGAGIAALNFQNLLINPVGAIAAGVALIALSGAVKGLLSRGPKSGGGGGVSGGGAGTVTPYRSPASSATFTTPGMGAESEVRFVIAGTELQGVLRNTSYKDGR